MVGWVGGRVGGGGRRRRGGGYSSSGLWLAAGLFQTPDHPSGLDQVPPKPGAILLQTSSVAFWIQTTPSKKFVGVTPLLNVDVSCLQRVLPSSRPSAPPEDVFSFVSARPLPTIPRTCCRTQGHQISDFHPFRMRAEECEVFAVNHNHHVCLLVEQYHWSWSVLKLFPSVGGLILQSHLCNLTSLPSDSSTKALSVGLFEGSQVARSFCRLAEERWRRHFGSRAWFFWRVRVR